MQDLVIVSVYVQEKRSCLWVVKECQGGLLPLEEACLSPVHKRKDLKLLGRAGGAHPTWKDLAFVYGLGFYVSQFFLL